ncbi:MAG: tryptophan--tRNA ligase [Candidatus Moranbacteria bacterium]|nr:tryptophan--tRNA ligase [Candidatus Moranbacteria bacterium]
MKQRIVSGIKPSGDLHIGNYLGAIAQWIKMQDEYEAFLFIADLHAITVPQKPEDLHRRTIEIAKIYLAAGIDPSRVTIFVQSQIHEHAELCWILNSIARIGDLEKMTQFKDKSSGDARETAGVGFFDYPVLMAGDIVMYDADFVPVGDDQVQHIELTRTLGRRFNKRFGDEVFIMPKPLLQESGARIMALDNPDKKMSKSSTSENSYIALSDEPEKARKKIMKAVTDSGTKIIYSDDKPALQNLITIYALFTDKKVSEIEAMYVGKGYAEFKTGLADVVVAFLEGFQEKYASISDDEVLAVLKEGAEKARPLAQQKIKEVKKLMGFVM